MCFPPWRRNSHLGLSSLILYESQEISSVGEVTMAGLLILLLKDPFRSNYRRSTDSEQWLRTCNAPFQCILESDDLG